MKTHRFIKQSEIDAPPEAVFAFHERPGIVEKLTPPWERIEMLEAAPDLKPGTRTVFKVFLGPIPRLWVAEHTEYIPDRLFADVQREGPFAYWYHRHIFEPTGRGTTLMRDDVEYALPLSRVSDLIAGRFVRAKLQRMFDYRHRVLAERMKGQDR
ncbi:MAG TPA: SRPBCC family protein [Blastocatellia bacterium]|nr:SRPBCC family protein [Blastocatellia bacterium]